MTTSKKKIDAIYDLRDAAERKARVQQAVEEQPTKQRKDELLDAKLELERKTVEAIDACHECGHVHEPNQDHVWKRSNVTDLNTRREKD